MRPDVRPSGWALLRELRWTRQGALFLASWAAGFWLGRTEQRLDPGWHRLGSAIGYGFAVALMVMLLTCALMSDRRSRLGRSLRRIFCR